MHSVAVYCGSSTGGREAYGDAAAALGSEIGRRGLRLVYGGASVGLMGMVADAALAAGAEVIGVIPRAIVDLEVAHEGLSDLVVTDDMHARKLRMAELADGFVALPGGLGTLDELFEIWTWRQLGFHDAPLGLLDVDGYYDSLQTFLDHATAEGFLRPPHRAMLAVEASAPALLDALSAAAAAPASHTSKLPPGQVRP